MRIGIMCPDVRRHDAIGNDAAGMYRALKMAGYDAYLFTISGQSETPYPTFGYHDADWLLAEPDDLLIYHLATVDPAALGQMRLLKCRIALKYHNVTPSRFMLPYSAVFAAACRQSRKAVYDFLSLPIAFAMADSRYNADELVEGGFPQDLCFTVPPFHHTSELLAHGDEPATANHLRLSGFNLLTVGRIVPNKGLHIMVEALGRLKADGHRNVGLQVVGRHDERLSAYMDEVMASIERLDLGDWVYFHPHTDGDALATFYRYSDLFWTASQHEGFCVPVIEAMAFGLPVLSTTRAALPETCGGAASYADTPHEMADRIKTFITDDVTARALGSAGRNRAAAFDEAVITDLFLRALRDGASGRSGGAEGATTTASGDWFDLPSPQSVKNAVVAFHGADHLFTVGHRRAAVSQLIQTGAMADYLASPDIKAYAERIVTPALGRKLSPAARLVWYFSDYAQQLFPLTSPATLSNYWRWFMRQANPSLMPLMSPYEIKAFKIRGCGGAHPAQPEA